MLDKVTLEKYILLHFPNVIFDIYPTYNTMERIHSFVGVYGINLILKVKDETFEIRLSYEANESSILLIKNRVV